MSRETECFSMYSDMSIRTMLDSSSNMNWANDLASSVFPTPVGPKKMKLPIGRRGSLRPERDLLIASATAMTASSWPMSRWWRLSSMCTNRSPSPSKRRPVGMPVHFETSSAISRSPTTMSVRRSFCRTLRSDSYSSVKRSLSTRSSAARSYSVRWAAVSSWSNRSAMRSSIFFTSAGRLSTSIRSLLAASSMKSTALSGSCRPVT